MKARGDRRVLCWRVRGMRGETEGKGRRGGDGEEGVGGEGKGRWEPKGKCWRGGWNLGKGVGGEVKERGNGGEGVGVKERGERWGKGSRGGEGEVGT